MEYRVAGEKDFDAIEKRIGQIDYFGPINPRTLGGHWLIAEQAGEIRGTIWFFASPPNAYIDYWSGKGRTAAKLGQLVEHVLKRGGVRYVRGNIHVTNSPAARLAIEGHGMQGHLQYILVYKDLMNGHAEDDSGNNDTSSRRAGTSPSRIIVPTR